VCVDLSSNSAARVEGERSGVFCVTRSSDLIHHIHTHTQTYESPEVSECLSVLRKSDTIEARVHSRLNTLSRSKRGVEVVRLKYFEETLNWNTYYTNDYMVESVA